jgi:hypothetical protein
VVLSHKLATRKAHIAFMQEPWVQEDQIRGLGGTGVTIFSVAYSAASRSYIYVRSNINTLLLLKFCSRDMKMVRIT